MSRQSSRSNRRGFLKTGLCAAAGAAAARSGWSAATVTSPEPGAPAAAAMPTRSFGRNGPVLPVLGHGGSAMVGMFIRSYGLELLPEEQRIAMVRHGYDRGIRYFDTARVYGESERLMGEALKDVREKVFIASKVAVAEPGQVRASVEASLKELQTDYVDLMQIHSPAIERVGFEGAMKIHAELEKLRGEKMIRRIGLTTHVAFETVCRMIETGGFDAALLAYGYFRKGMDTMLSNANLEWRERCMARAHDRGMAIIAMKVMGAMIFGHNAKNLVPGYEPAALRRLPAAAIRWVMQDERVSMLNIGISIPADIDENIRTLTADRTFTNEDRDLLAAFSQRAYESEVVKSLRVT